MIIHTNMWLFCEQKPGNGCVIIHYVLSENRWAVLFPNTQIYLKWWNDQWQPESRQDIISCVLAPLYQHAQLWYRGAHADILGQLMPVQLKKIVLHCKYMYNKYRYVYGTNSTVFLSTIQLDKCHLSSTITDRISLFVQVIYSSADHHCYQLSQLKNRTHSQISKLQQ